MSDKKSKSKSKSKQKDQKPPKDAKSKKSKDSKADKGDKKQKKSVEKGSKKSIDKKSDIDKKSKISKPPDDIQSQSDFSMFKPFLFNPPPQQVDESLCPYHNLKNLHFCEVCQQVACQNCLVYGPHNNQMHRISKLDQSFKGRYLYLNELVCNDLLQKRDKLTAKLQQLNVICDELRYFKNGIEKNIKIELSETMDKLNISAGNKFAILNHQMACLQQDLQAINSLGNEFFQLTNLNPEKASTPETNPHKGMVPFLLRAKFLQEQAQELISKPIKTSVDVFPYDLPRQVTQKKIIIEKNRGWLDLLKVKDEVIWLLLEQKKESSQKLWETFQQQVHEEVQQWQKLNTKLQQEINSFRMNCSKCGVALSQQIINEQCQKGQQGDLYHYFLA